MSRGREQDRNWDRIALAILGTGLALQLWLWSRSWMYYDQVMLLRRGMELALDGHLAAYAKNMSGGGVIPGSLLQLVVGLPLMAWFDYRSPALLVGALQLAAVLLLWRTLRSAAGPRAAALFVGLYWLSPWRLYHSGFIWEPSYLLLPAALHFWGAYRQRTSPAFAPSLALGASLLLAGQLHASAFVLLLLTAALWLRGEMRVHFPGLAVGAVAGGLSLLPAVVAFVRGTLPAVGAGGGWTELGILKVYPVVKAFGYWFRLPSLDAGRRIKQTVFMASDAGGPAMKLLCEAMLILGSASILLCLVANWHVLVRAAEGREGNERFLRQYALHALPALLVATAVSTITIQSWHTLVVLHAACIAPALWLGRRLPSARRVWQVVFVGFVVLRIPLALVFGAGHPMYRIPDDPIERARVHPDNLPRIEAVDAPFGKETRRESEP